MKSWEWELEERTVLAPCAGPRGAMSDLGCRGSPCCGVCAGGGWMGVSQPGGCGGSGLAAPRWAGEGPHLLWGVEEAQ